MEKNSLVVVTGMTGVGKDYLVDRSVEGLPISKIGWGDMLGEELGAHKDLMMNTIDPDVILDGQFAVCRKVLQMQPVAAVCHVVKPENGQYVYNFEIEKMLNPSSYVFITAPAELIYQRVQRRNLLGARKSQEVSADEIERVQNVKLEAVKTLAAILGSRAIEINNVAEELDANVATLRELFASVCQLENKASKEGAY